jgi:hypothetical protein
LRADGTPEAPAARSDSASSRPSEGWPRLGAPEVPPYKDGPGDAEGGTTLNQNVIPPDDGVNMTPGPGLTKPGSSFDDSIGGVTLGCAVEGAPEDFANAALVQWLRRAPRR